MKWMAGMTAFVDSLFPPNVLFLIPLWSMYASATNLSLAKVITWWSQPIFLWRK